jgi:hypothetical protein
MSSRMKLAILALALMVPLTACDTGADPAFGSVTVLLTDEPGDLAKAWVTITDIYLQGHAGDSDPAATRVYLLQGADKAHDLLKLANVVAELVMDASVPTGTYGQLRVVMSGGCVVTNDGAVYSSPSYSHDDCKNPQGTLQMPSFAQTGAKVLLHGLTVTGGQNVVVLDFDVARSFSAGESGNYVLTPVIRGATLELTAGVDVTLSAGDVELPEGTTLAGFSATLTPEEGDASTQPFLDMDGVYQAGFRYLMPDNSPFTLALNMPDGVDVAVSPASPKIMDLASGKISTIAWVLQQLED